MERTASASSPFRPARLRPWVREQWVGLELPLAQSSRDTRSRRVFGVLSGPRNLLAWWFALLTGRARHESGYAVRVADALAVLEKKSPEAAAWWRENVPHMQSPLRCFLFAGSVCQVLDEFERRFER